MFKVHQRVGVPENTSNSPLGPLEGYSLEVEVNLRGKNARFAKTVNPALSELTPHLG